MEDHQTSASPEPAPTVEASPPKFRVKFADGPAKGVTREYDRERSSFKIGPWTYEATGKRDGDFWLFVKRPTQRMARKLITALSTARGEDVRLLPRDEPRRVIHRGRNEPCWCGSGTKFKKCHGSE